MSLEQELSANTAAIQALTEVWGKLAAMGTTIRQNVVEGKQDKTSAAGVIEIPLNKTKAKTEPKEAAAPVETAQAAIETVAPPAPEPATESSAAPAAEPPTMAQLSTAVTAAATRNRDGLVAALAAKGVKRAGEIPQDQWAAFIAEVSAL